jgi:hypothetical protein
VSAFLRAMGQPDLQGDGRLANALMGTFHALPEDCQNMVLGRLAAVVAHHDVTGDLQPVQHFCESLVMTVRAQQCRAYVMAAAVREEPGEPRDVHDVIAEIEARHSEQGT